MVGVASAAHACTQYGIMGSDRNALSELRRQANGNNIERPVSPRNDRAEEDMRGMQPSRGRRVTEDPDSTRLALRSWCGHRSSFVVYHAATSPPGATSRMSSCRCRAKSELSLMIVSAVWGVRSMACARPTSFALMILALSSIMPTIPGESNPRSSSRLRLNLLAFQQERP